MTALTKVLISENRIQLNFSFLQNRTINESLFEFDANTQREKKNVMLKKCKTLKC